MGLVFSTKAARKSTPTTGGVKKPHKYKPEHRLSSSKKLLSLLEMSSLVERLRVRSERGPIYNLDESDDDADFVSGKA
ncbi:GYMNOS family protein [Salix suchowensis]|nr:GYMNOS family protein [Salix suchowensis]